MLFPEGWSCRKNIQFPLVPFLATEIGSRSVYRRTVGGGFAFLASVSSLPCQNVGKCLEIIISAEMLAQWSEGYFPYVWKRSRQINRINFDCP